MSLRVDWSELQSQIRGVLAVRDDARYEELRRALIWSERVPARRPAAVLRVCDAEDVAHAVRFAAERGLCVALRSGGHSWCASALRDDALVLDLRALRDISVDVDARRARVGPAVRNDELAARIDRDGLAFPYGHCPSVALGGYLLSGGFGWNSGVFGPACVHVRSIDLIDASGTWRRVSSQVDADLYWAARGAGALFCGVVVAFELELLPAPRVIHLRCFDFDGFPPAALEGALSDLLRARRSALELSLFSFPKSASRRVEVNAVAFAADDGEARELMQPLEALSKMSSHRREEQDLSFEKLLHDLGACFPEGRRHGVDVFYSQSAWGALQAEVFDAIADAPSPHSFGMIVPAPPIDASAPPLPDMALSMFAPSFVGLYGQWERASEDAANEAWLRNQCEQMRDLRCGYYIGESDLFAESDRVSRCFTPEAFARLMRVRQQWDPNGVFGDLPLSS